MNPSDLIFFGDFIYKDRNLTPKQLGISSRQINYWIDKKVVPFVEKQQVSESSSGPDFKTKWIRLNIPQGVWVCIVKELLSMGVSIGDLEKFAKTIWHKPRQDKYADEVLTDFIKHNKDKFPLEVQNIEMSLKDDLLMEHDLRTQINPFTDLVKSAILRENQPHSLIFIPKTLGHAFLSHSTELFLRLSSQFYEHPVICIPIMPLICKVLSLEFFNPKLSLSYLSEIEKQIRDIVVYKKPKSVVIAFENNEIKPITITEQHKTKEQLLRYLLENKIRPNSKLLVDIRSQGNYQLTLISK